MEHHQKIHCRKSRRCTQHARCKITSLNKQCCPFGNCDGQCCYVDPNRNCDSNHCPVNCLCDEHPLCNSKYHCNNQYASNQKLGLEKNGKVSCRMHSFLDQLAKHTRAKCLENPTNQKKPALQSTVDAQHARVNNHYLSNVSGTGSFCTDFASKVKNIFCTKNDDNNFATVLVPSLAPKKSAPKASCTLQRMAKCATKKRKTIAAPNSNSNKSNHASAHFVLDLASTIPRSVSPWTSCLIPIDGTRQLTVPIFF